MTFPQTAILDAFTRADGVLGSNWGIASGYWQFLIESNTVRGYPSPALMYWAADSFSSTQEAYTTIQATTSKFVIPGVALCVNTPTTVPAGYIVTFSGTTWKAMLLDGTVLDSGALPNIAVAGCGIGAAYDNGVITVWYKDINGSNTWEAQGTVADATYNTGGYIGLYWSNGVTVESLGVVDVTPNVTLPIGGSITTADNTASGGDTVRFDIDSAAERSSGVLGCAIGVGEFPGDYITHSLTPADNYTTWVNVADNVTAYETLSSTVSHVSFLDDALILTPGLYSDVAAGADFDARFFMRVDTANHGDIDTSSAAGQWLVQVFSGTNQTLTNLFDDFGGGDIPQPLTKATVSGGACVQHLWGSATLTGGYLPAVAGAVTYTWSPEPDSGQGTATAVYDSFSSLGINLITFTVTNALNSVSVIHPVNVWGCAVLDIVDALAAQSVTFTTVQGQNLTPTALKPENLPKSVDGHQLPIRLLMPADENLETNNFGFIAIGKTSQINWQIVDLMLLKPVSSDLGLHGGVGRDLMAYAKSYVEMLTTFRNPTDQSYITTQSTTVQAGTFFYPPASQRAYYGVLCVVAVNELISGCGG